MMSFFHLFMTSRSSVNRLENVIKGHELWNVVDNNTEEFDQNEHLDIQSQSEGQEDDENNVLKLFASLKVKTNSFNGITVDLKVSITI